MARPAEKLLFTQVDDQFIVRGYGGCPLFVDLKGNPDGELIVFMHGGPCGTYSVPLFRSYVGRILEQEYQVAYYYQRHAIEPSELPYSIQFPVYEATDYSIQAHLIDTYHVIEDLLKRTNQKQCHLISHSWGSLLSFGYLAQYDYLDRVKSHIAIAPSTDSTANQIHGWRMARKEAIKQSKAKELMKLNLIGCGPWRDANSVGILLEVCDSLFGSLVANIDHSFVLKHSGFQTIDALKWKERRLKYSFAMWDELHAASTLHHMPKLKVPMLIVASNKDYFVPKETIKLPFDLYGSRCLDKPRKELATFDDAGHSIYSDAPQQFIELAQNFLHS